MAVASSNSHSSSNVRGTWVSEFGLLSSWKRLISGVKLAVSSLDRDSSEELEELKLNKESKASGVCSPSLVEVETWFLEYWVVSEFVVVDFGEFLIQPSSNLAMFSALEAYVDADDDWAGLVLDEILESAGKELDLSMDKASHSACLAMWISV